MLAAFVTFETVNVNELPADNGDEEKVRTALI